MLKNVVVSTLCLKQVVILNLPLKFFFPNENVHCGIRQKVSLLPIQRSDCSFSSTQVLLCLFPGVLWLWHFLYGVGPHPVSSLLIYTFVVSRAFMAGATSQAGDADSSRAPGRAVTALFGAGPGSPQIGNFIDILG